jgi:glycosyltransferase involved in cell wall biosynthesis
MGLAHATVGVSKAVTRAMRRRHIPAHRLHTIYNGIAGSARRAELSEDKLREFAHPMIVTLGSVSHRKGADVLYAAFIEVLRSYPDAHLYYLGNCDWREFVSAVRTGPHRAVVHFEGLQQNPVPYLSRADVFAFPSRREPLGLAVLEAMEAGCAVVATDVDGIPELLAPGCAGLLVPSENPHELALAINTLLGDDAANAEMRNRALEASRKFSVITMADEYVDLYRLMLAP